MSFEIVGGESVRNRVVRCCDELLRDGPMGHGLRQPDYRAFINCGMVPAGKIGSRYVDDISPWATSCAMFVRAVLARCGRPTKIAVNAQPIFGYIQADTSSSSWNRVGSGYVIQPGDVFYVATSLQSNDGHVGIFLSEYPPGHWRTAEGGQGIAGATPYTGCAFSQRRMAKFDSWRALQGVFNVEAMDVPYLPRSEVSDAEVAEDDGKKRDAENGGDVV